ncbi:MAG: amidohydrolase family protein [Bacteroidota bacterium]
MNRFLFISAFCSFTLLFSSVKSQETFPFNGPKNEKHILYAFVNATVFVDYQTKIEGATLLVQDGKVVSVSKNAPPKNALIIESKGKIIYPSFIDAFTNYGMPEVKKGKREDRNQFLSTKKGAYNWNQAIKPEINSAELFTADNASAETFRKLGFGAVHTQASDGICRGTGAVVLLSNEKENTLFVSSKSSANYSFDKGSSTQDYPSSLMGSIALLKQTYLDAEWYSKNDKTKETNISLEAFNQTQNLTQLFEVKDKYNVLRAVKIAKEFGKSYVFKTAGDEYMAIKEIAETKSSLIVPLNFPEAFDVSDPLDAHNISLEDLKHWENAPFNPYYLHLNKIPFSITSADLKEKKTFLTKLKKAIDCGLPVSEALKALTYFPAKQLGVDNVVGALKPGMLANFIICNNELGSAKFNVEENWIKGEQFVIEKPETVDIRGKYDFVIDSNKLVLTIDGESSKPKATFSKDTIKYKSTISIERKLINFTYVVDSKTIRLSGEVLPGDSVLKGIAINESGAQNYWNAKLIESKKTEAKPDSNSTKKEELGSVWFPNMAYGFDTLPTKNNYLIKNTNVWTNEQEGILKNYDVLVQNGKITKIDKNISATGVEIIDGKEKHLTAGIIDEHSHIAISGGVNEWAQASSAEVSISDVVNPEDINIYRQLAGGVTVAQLLHGSANPVGGQSAIIKLRWGQTPEKMKIEGADGFIKFALGENVKQSGSLGGARFPQSRMGVEQSFYDIFIRAKEYESQKNNALKNKTAFRKDLELETISEILNKKRFITCHSYVQSEINMLMHVADSMKFRVNTFTHILEGYKVADKMKNHGVGASTFSDWWAYKFEVMDAIPYNAALLTQQGVVTAINSDDAEMARRLNQEAAKTVKYGGLSEEEALKTVTLNPAKLLHLEAKMGSIKVGKDADIVLWTNNPLSVYAKAEKTFIDGVCLYDRTKEETIKQQNNNERQRIIQKMIDAKSGGEKTQKANSKKQQYHYHCDSLEEYYYE